MRADYLPNLSIEQHLGENPIALPYEKVQGG